MKNHIRRCGGCVEAIGAAMALIPFLKVIVRK